MLLTHDTGFRLFTFSVLANELGGIQVGVAVCHYRNGDTGEVIETPDPVLGRRLAEKRMAIDDTGLYAVAIHDAVHKALRAGHVVTLRDITLATVLEAFDYGDLNGSPGYISVLNGMMDEAREADAEMTPTEMRAWEEHDEVLMNPSDDEMWVLEMMDEGYDDDFRDSKFW